jgi:hypothetical protein
MDKKARVFVHGRFFGVSLYFLPLNELTAVHSVDMLLALQANTLVRDKLFSPTILTIFDARSSTNLIKTRRAKTFIL